MEAEVVSSDLKAPRRRYVTTITVAPFTDEQMHAARKKITAQPCWKALIRYPPSVVGTPLLERLKFAGVPYQLMEVLDYHWGSVNESEVIKASCTCNDKYTKGCWCKHVAALSFELVELCETHPESLFVALGASLQSFEVHGREELLPVFPVVGKFVEWGRSPANSPTISVKRPRTSRTAGLEPGSGA